MCKWAFVAHYHGHFSRHQEFFPVELSVLRERELRAVCWFPFGRSLSEDSAIKEVPAWGFYRTYWCTATHKSPPGSPSKREKWKPAAKCRHACQVLYLAFGSQNMRFSVLTRSRYTFLPRVLFPGFQVSPDMICRFLSVVAPFLGYRIYRSITLKCTWYANLPKNRRPLLPKSWHIVFILRIVLTRFSYSARLHCKISFNCLLGIRWKEVISLEKQTLGYLQVGNF